MANTRYFDDFARWVARRAARGIAFGFALATVLVWAVLGPLFGFSDTWQLVINTGTTVVTFLMVFLIQNAQVRDSEALQVKLDELLRVHRQARNALMDLEELSQEDLERIKDHYEALARKARKAGEHRDISG